MTIVTSSAGIVETARAATRKVLGPRLIRYIRRRLSSTKPLASVQQLRSRLQGKCGLEIGGPTSLFGEDGLLPIYDVLRSLDNCLFSAKTVWEGDVKEGSTFRFHPGKEAGRQFIREATDLQTIPNASYECVLASHCLEHSANPCRALSEWKRVLKQGGLLLLVIPHKDGTFDWRRPTTTLAHMISDFEQNVGEDDLTHLPEILNLHDLSRDKAAGTKNEFSRRCLQNFKNRCMHHHVFDTMSALILVDYARFGIIEVEAFGPHHILILAKNQSGAADNQEFMKKNAEHWQRSPFPSDRL